MEEMVEGVNRVLSHAQDMTGILDLDSPLDQKDVAYDTEGAPVLPENATRDWVHEAKLILSPFGRPVGWYLDVGNRSVAYTLLQHAHVTPIKCAWKSVTTQPTTLNHVQKLDDQPYVSEATLRVETNNNHFDVTEFLIMNLFARYDLTQDREAIVEWKGITNDGKAPPKTFLVHFEDASWARAALREKQGTILSGKPVWLAPYPRQQLTNMEV